MLQMWMQFKDFYCVCTKFTHLPKHKKFSLVPIAKVSINITNNVFFIRHFKAILASGIPLHFAVPPGNTRMIVIIDL